MQISRLFEIIYVLLDKKNVTAVELAERFEVSTRTIYRDVEALTEAGIPIYCERGKKGGIRLTNQFVLNKSLLSERERTDILTGLKSLAVTGADDGSSLKRLSSFLGGSDNDWVAIDFSDWSNSRQELFKSIKDSILNKLEIYFDYYNSNSEMARRHVRPVQLWFKGHNWYLRAYDCDKAAMRVFKLSRIKRFEIGTTHFMPFSIEAETPITNNAPKTPIIIKVKKEMAFRVYDEFDEEDITRLADGEFIIHSFFPRDEWVLGLILSYGPYAEILGPPEYRQSVSERIKNIVKIYENPEK